jgi:ferredoxin--NADP+ reductase/benzoate/toluate 1,2-dioxygenase reductase subunit
MTRQHIFIATGTGISPFHSIVKSHPEIDYSLIHGVRFREEAYESDMYDSRRYFLCTSRESVSGRQGRVTNFLEDFTITEEMVFYLCGNSGMIHDVKNILKNKKVPAECIFTEVYF